MNLGGGSGDDPSSSSVSQWSYAVSRRYQHLLDKSTPLVYHRWIGFFLVALIYSIRVFLLQGYYIITYGLGIYILQLFILFLSPQVDPEIQDLSDGPSLPTRGSDEFRPFVRRLPEFKFWYSITKAFCFAFVLTFFSAFDVPVFWPILLFYWVVLFVSTMKRQIMHMVKYKYVPFSFGKQRYVGKKVASTDDTDNVAA
ncbi:Protein RER1A [Camellia lanceoleosa]|uniref:Protein RER1A n=1 Tax=Camellia lanceoleosa TaxID=1840588 RepID=A0ACC0HU26_9ERIC|nr:Protein RER1A [Camellia lanceoleosa]